jgi:hypothetical protein
MSFIVFLSATQNVMAQEKQQGRHMALTLLQEKGMDVEFLGAAYGMDGWLIKNDKGNVQYAYSTPQGGLVMGVLYGSDGLMVTNKQVASYKERQKRGDQAILPDQGANPISPTSPSEKIYGLTERLNWFSVGKKTAPYIYVFINPTCIHCLEYWKKSLERQVTSGVLQIRFIPFGSSKENRRTSAVLLSADNPEQLWLSYVGGNADALSLDIISDAGYEKTDQNTDMWKNHELPSPPFTLYRAPADGKIKAVIGVPENNLLMMADFIK